MIKSFIIGAVAMTISSAHAAEAGVDVTKSRWYAVNDDVMGGKSEGGPAFQGSHLVFAGSTNTNGGGFSSIRLDVAPGRFADATGFEISAAGDGRGYELSFTTNARNWGRTVNFRAPIPLSTPGETQSVVVSFSALKASVWGRPLANVRFDPAAIRTLGFFIYDKKDGPFRLEVAGLEPSVDSDGPVR